MIECTFLTSCRFVIAQKRLFPKPAKFGVIVWMQNAFPTTVLHFKLSIWDKRSSSESFVHTCRLTIANCESEDRLIHSTGLNVIPCRIQQGLSSSRLREDLNASAHESKKARSRRALLWLKVLCAVQFARSMYLPVRVSILIFSPVLMNSGACTVMPVSTVMAFCTLLAKATHPPN